MTPFRKRLASDPHYKWYVVGMLWGISFFNYADRQAVFSVFPLLAAQMHLSKQEQLLFSFLQNPDKLLG